MKPGIILKVIHSFSFISVRSSCQGKRWINQMNIQYSGNIYCFAQIYVTGPYSLMNLL